MPLLVYYFPYMCRVFSPLLTFRLLHPRTIYFDDDDLFIYQQLPNAVERRGRSYLLLNLMAQSHHFLERLANSAAFGVFPYFI